MARGAELDMALFKFTKGILDSTPIEIFNNGDMQRDFTYIDDLAKAVVLLSDAMPAMIRRRPAAPASARRRHSASSISAMANR